MATWPGFLQVLPNELRLMRWKPLAASTSCERRRRNVNAPCRGAEREGVQLSDLVSEGH